MVKSKVNFRVNLTRDDGTCPYRYSTVDAWAGSESIKQNDRRHGKRCGSIAPCPRNVSAAYRLECMSSVWQLI